MSASRAVEVKLLDPRFGDEWPLPFVQQGVGPCKHAAQVSFS